MALKAASFVTLMGSSQSVLVKWNRGLGLLLPYKSAQKNEKCAVFYKFLDLLVSHMGINMLLYFHFPPVYFMLYFYIIVHLQLGMPNKKSIFLQAFLLLNWATNSEFGELPSYALHFCTLMTNVMLLTCLLTDYTKTFDYLYLTFINCSPEMWLDASNFIHLSE